MIGFREIIHRRTILVYILAIVAPALVLLYFGVESFQRQRQAVGSLLNSNLRLSGERVAADLERRATQLAQACLREVEQAPTGELAGLCRKHPIAQYFFLMDGGQVVYPPLRTPPPQSPDELPAPPEYTEAFQAAESQELSREDLDAALAGYRNASRLPVSNTLRARALQRVARCLEKMNRVDEARQTYQALSDKYGDLTDLSHRPYALVAALAGVKRAEVRNDLLRGRWQLSAEQMDYFLPQLGGAVDGAYAAQLQFARRLEEQFRQHASLQPGEVYAYAFDRYQIFYHLSGENRLQGFSVNPDWAKEQLGQEAWRIVPKGSGGSEARIGFPSLFPFWELANNGSSGNPGPNGLFTHAAITALVLCLLLMGVLLLIRDVSREARLNQLRADFVGAVSHELKTPITLIRLYGETLLDDEDFSPQQRREFYQIIAHESEGLTQLIDKVLSFSKIERGERQYRLEHSELVPVVARTVEVYEQYLKRRGFSVKTQLAPELGAVSFDADAVSQALVNLLDNAAKYSGETKSITVRSFASDGAVVLEVEDHGIGIPLEEQPKVFERFYRVKNAAAKGGYGLGLYLVRHIMDAHGGRVELESEPGKGSRFRLVFHVERNA